MKCPKCPPPQCYTTKNLSPDGICKHCGSKLEELREISFVDAPGHEILMATCLSGASLLDAAILVIAADEPCPQPQTSEHLAALEIVGVDNIIIVQNKIELVSREKAIEHYNQIKNFIKGTIAENAPIIPVSAIFKSNMDILLETIEKQIPTPERDLDKPARMLIARSFDINKPGTPPEKLFGGVVGGSIIQGKLKVGDTIEIRPGYKIDKSYKPLITKIVSLVSGSGNKLEEAYPGGLIGVGTELDPSLTKADRLVGNVLGEVGTLPPTKDMLIIKPTLMKRLVGSRKEQEIANLRQSEPLMIVVGTAATVGIIRKLAGDKVHLALKRPVVAEPGQRVAIGRAIEKKWRLIGHGIIVE